MLVIYQISVTRHNAKNNGANTENDLQVWAGLYLILMSLKMRMQSHSFQLLFVENGFDFAAGLHRRCFIVGKSSLSLLILCALCDEPCLVLVEQRNNGPYLT